jgi:hypothetical protein
MAQTDNYFDQAKVDHVIRFIESLTLTKATKSDEPEPFILLPHWREAITQLYGWRRPDGRRQYRKAFLTCGRKQAKTQFAAGVCTYEFFMGDTARHEIYFAATDVSQAGICFDAVHDMIKAEPDLLELCRITPSLKRIENRQNGNIMRVLSAEGAGKHGYNPSLVVCDELHAWGPAHMELYRALTTGGKSRRDPLRIMPTTAGHDMESLWGQEYQYAKEVLSGKIKDQSYLAMIHEVPIDADWRDRSLWPLALPLLKTGHHQLEDYEEDFLKAEHSKAEEATFRRLYLNQPMGSETAWLDIQLWDERTGAVSEDVLRQAPCFGGLDLGATRDLTAFTLVWKLPDGNVFLRSWGYLPEDDVRGREKRDAVPYGQWALDGHIVLTPGNVTDWRFVADHIRTLNEQYQIQSVCYDAWGARDTAVALAEGGMEVIKFGQDYRDQSPAVKRVEDLLHMGRLIHENDASLRWCVDNTMVKSDDNGHRKIAKVQRLTNRKRIDKAASMVMAIGGLIQAEEYSDPYSDGRATLN